MTKSLYLKIIGITELVFSGIGMIVGLIYVIAITAQASWVTAQIGITALNGFALFLIWLAYLVYCFYAPAVGILFLVVARHEEEGPVVVHSSPARTSEHVKRIAKLEEEVKNLRRKLVYMDSVNEVSKQQQEVIKDDSPSEPKEEQVQEEPAKKSEIAKNKDKDSYALDDRVQFNQDVMVNGVQVNKGDTGIIDNRMYTSGGRVYIVVLDKNKESVKVSGLYFE